jgi:hypothetical protein
MNAQIIRPPCLSVIVTIGLCISAVVASSPEKNTAAEPSSAPSLGQREEGESPSGKIRYILQGKEDSKQLFLYSNDQPTEKVALCETPGWGNLLVSFSPNEQWLVVQDGGASLGLYLRLFHKRDGVKYEEVEDANVDGKTELAALKENGLPAMEILEHRYVHVLPWSADSTKFMVELSGRGQSGARRIRITDWIGIYDVTTGAISTDLAQMNRGAADVSH